MTKEEMITEFQCPGCVNGIEVSTCKNYMFADSLDGAFRCAMHVPGTGRFGAGLFFLGLPKGFNKVSNVVQSLGWSIRLWKSL